MSTEAWPPLKEISDILIFNWIYPEFYFFVVFFKNESSKKGLEKAADSSEKS